MGRRYNPRMLLGVFRFPLEIHAWTVPLTLVTGGVIGYVIFRDRLRKRHPDLYREWYKRTHPDGELPEDES